MLKFGMKNRDLIGVDIGDTSLRIAHIRYSPIKTETVSLLNKNIQDLSDDEISRVAKGAFHALKVKDPKIIIIIPSHLVITKNIEIPSIDPREIREIVNLQAGRHTPYSREEIIVDYVNIGVSKHSYTKILLVIVTRNIVKRQLDIMDKTGLRLEKILFAPEGLALSASRILRLETQDLPSGIIHIDENFTDFSIVFRNKAVFIRAIPIGAQYLVNEKEKYEARFAEELKRSLEAYQSENIDKTPNELVMTGAIEECRGLGTFLGDNVKIPIRVVPYLSGLSMSSEAFKAASLAKRISFLNVISPLLAMEEAKVDLTPEDIKLKNSLEEKGRDLIKTGIFVLAIFVLICVALVSKIYFKGAYLKSLDANYQPLNQEAQALEKDFTKVGIIRNYLSDKGYAVEVLSELHNIIPLNLEIADIRYEKAGKFNIKGTAESMSAVFSFVSEMEKSKYFKDVKTRYTSKRKDGSKDMTDFEIVSMLEKGAGQ